MATIIENCLLDTYLVDPAERGARRVPASDLGRHSQFVVWHFAEPSAAFPLLRKHVQYVDRVRTYPAVNLDVVKTDRPLILRRPWIDGNLWGWRVNIYCPRMGETFPAGSRAYAEVKRTISRATTLAGACSAHASPTSGSRNTT